jgi:hypothetical protein
VIKRLEVAILEKQTEAEPGKDAVEQGATQVDQGLQT